MGVLSLLLILGLVGVLSGALFSSTHPIFGVLLGSVFFNFTMLYLVLDLKLTLLMLEGGVVFILLFCGLESFDSGYLLFMGVLVALSFFSMSPLLVPGGHMGVFLFFMLLLKSGMVSLLFFLVSKSEGGLGLISYILVSKSLVVFYGFLFSNLLEDPLPQMYTSVGGCVVLFLWVGMILMAYYLLFIGNFIGYFICLLNLSHIFVIMSLFFNFKMFLISFFVDVIIFLLVIYTLSLNLNVLNYSNLSGVWGGLFLFLLSGHLLGVPPFPSFFLEMGFVVPYLFLFKGVGSAFFLGVVYLALTFQFCSLFLYMGRLQNSPKESYYLGDSLYVLFFMFLGVFIMLMFQVGVSFGV